jgi:hypothetical protein
LARISPVFDKQAIRMLSIEQTERWEVMQADAAAQKVHALTEQGKLRERLAG